MFLSALKEDLGVTGMWTPVCERTNPFVAHWVTDAQILDSCRPGLNYWWQIAFSCVSNILNYVQCEWNVILRLTSLMTDECRYKIAVYGTRDIDHKWLTSPCNVWNSPYPFHLCLKELVKAALESVNCWLGVCLTQYRLRRYRNAMSTWTVVTIDDNGHFYITDTSVK